MIAKSLSQWEEKAIKTLLQKMMQLSIIACVFTLIFEYFFPHELDYVVTLSLLTINTLGLWLSMNGYEKISYHGLILAILSLFVIMDWGYGHRYYSAFKIFALGVVFAFVVLKKNQVIIGYVVLITLLECLSVYSFVANDAGGDRILLVYEWIHVVAYNFALAFMCYFLVNHVAAHRKKIHQKTIDFQDLQIQLSQEQTKAYKNILIGQEKERQRLSQDIHDGLSIRLTQLKAKLKPVIANNELLLSVIADFEVVQDDLRNISHALNPTMLKDFGLKKAINDLLFQIELNDADIDLNFTYSSSLSLNQEQEKHLYYIIQELLNNAIKHSDAKRISISLDNQNGKVNMEFSDTGKGYDLAAIKGNGIGINNIRSRVAVLGGSFDVVRRSNGMKHSIKF